MDDVASASHDAGELVGEPRHAYKEVAHSCSEHWAVLDSAENWPIRAVHCVETIKLQLSKAATSRPVLDVLLKSGPASIRGAAQTLPGAGSEGRVWRQGV